MAQGSAESDIYRREDRHYVTSEALVRLVEGDCVEEKGAS